MRTGSIEELAFVPVSLPGASGATDAPLGGAALAEDVAVDAVRIAPGGSLPAHAGRRTQWWVVLAGTGWVSGDDGERRDVGQGDVVGWDRGEPRAMGTDTGLTVVSVRLRAPEPA